MFLSCTSNYILFMFLIEVSSGYKYPLIYISYLFKMIFHWIIIFFLLFVFQEYFYGLRNDLCPHSNVVNFSDLHVYRIGGGPQAPRSALPIGAEPTADPTRLVPVNINSDLLHLVLAVSYAKEPNQIISR